MTEAYLYNPDIEAKVNCYAKIIEEFLVQKEIVFSEDVELFIQVEDDDFTYYFVDHAARTQFWLDAFDTDDSFHLFLCHLPRSSRWFHVLVLPQA